MMRTVDALIIGGGPAGLAAGIVLGRAGFTVLLCERQTFPIDKVCGEGLMPTGVQHLEQLNIRVRERFPFAGIRYVAPAGGVATAAFREGVGWGIRRTALSGALFSAAQEVASLCVMQHVAAVPQSCGEQGVEVRVGDQLVRARLVIGADGLRSQVRRWAGLDNPGRRHWRWGARQHFRVRPWSNYVEVHWSEHGVEAYVTPVAEEQVGIAFLWHRGRYVDLHGGDDLIPSLAAAFPALQSRLRGAGAVNEGRAVGPLQRRAKAVVSDGVLLLGDAAGYLDAITGEGLSVALAQALALKETVVPGLQNSFGLIPWQALARYQAAYARIVHSSAQLTELALLLSRFPALCNWVTRALGRDPVLFQQLLSANMGLQSPYRFPTALRLVVGLGTTVKEFP